MPASPVYLDECVHYGLVEALRKRGFVVYAARDEGMTHASDEAQLAYATARAWMILTYNADDFRRLHGDHLREGRSHGGIIVIPQSTAFRVLEVRAAMMLAWVGTLPVHHTPLLRWGQLQELLERGYLPPGYGADDVRLALGR